MRFVLEQRYSRSEGKTTCNVIKERCVSDVIIYWVITVSPLSLRQKTGSITASIGFWKRMTAVGDLRGAAEVDLAVAGLFKSHINGMQTKDNVFTALGVNLIEAVATFTQDLSTKRINLPGQDSANDIS